ncbi:uncharacterized protein LOC143292561 [Babylonia areolata]|uniref:uncharacterized protein LOC143292561 n=1 Tax=Babylonia areolata TaxID=304850 RepID=UPI003FD20DC5
MTHWLLLTSLVVAAIVTASQAQNLSERYECPFGNRWSLMEQNIVDRSSEVFCYSVGSARSLEDALSYCHQQQAWLLSPIRSSRSPPTYYTPSGMPLVDLLASNGVTDFWFGFHVRDGRIRRDTFPMTQLRGPNFQFTVTSEIPWFVNNTNTQFNEPSGSSNCFQMAVSSTNVCASQPSNLPLTTLAPPVNNQPSRQARSAAAYATGSGSLLSVIAKARMKRHQGRHAPDLSDPERKIRRRRQAACRQVYKGSVKSLRCQEQLPFVCVKPALMKNFVRLGPLNTLCQRDEFGHAKIPRCFSYGRENVNQSTAQARCEAKDPDGQRPRFLYRPNSDSSSFSLLLNRLISIFISSAVPGLRPERLAWVGRKKEEEEEGDRERCLALNLDTHDVMSWDCSALLSIYVCQAEVTMPGVGKLVMRVNNPDPSRKVRISSIRGSDDQEVWVPPSLIEPWSRLNATLELACEYDGGLIPDLQSMTLVKRGIPMTESKPTATEGIPGDDPYGGVPLSRISVHLRRGYSSNENLGVEWNVTDYYWCEVNDLKSGQVHRSGRVFVRPQGVMVYAVSIAMGSPQYTRSSLIVESLVGRENDGIIDQNIGFMEFKVVRFRPRLSPRQSNQTIVDFLFFNATRTNASSVSTQRLVEAQMLFRNAFNSTRISYFGFDTSTLEVKSIDICPNMSMYDPVSNKMYAVPEKQLGESYTSPQLCWSTGEPYVSLTCEGDKLYGAQWSKFKPILGCQYDDADTSSVTVTLQNISESTISEATVDDVVRDTQRAVEGKDPGGQDLTPLDLVYLADILQRVARLDRLPPQTVQRILEVVDATNGVNGTVLEGSNQLGNATNRILRAVDELGNKITLDDDVSHVRVVADTTALEVWNLSRVTGDIIVGLELQLSGGQPVTELDPQDLVSLSDNPPTHTDTDAAILLQGSFVRRLVEDNRDSEVRLAMNVFADTALFQHGRLEPEGEEGGGEGQGRGHTNPQQTPTPTPTARRGPVLNSKVIAAKVTVGGTAVVDLKSYNVTTVYLPVVRLAGERHAGNSTCVFWDFSGAGGQGAWSTEGCRYLRSQESRDVCVCDHLTNFAVLLDVYGQAALPQSQQLALSVITIVGLSLSILGLSCTVISFLLIKKLREGRPQQTLFNMALAMLAAWVVFLAGFDRVESYQGCLAVAALLHYLILASFMWMLMEGLLQYLLFVRVLGTEFDHYLLKTAVVAWGLPLIPVIVVLAIDTDLYHGGDQYCWMSLTPFYYAFLAPVAVIILVNIVVYIMVVVNICLRRNIGGSSSKNSSRAVGIRASVACFVVLGLSWLFAFFAIEDARVVFQYLFTITASLQGFLIFLIFTARDPAVRAFWRHACCGGSKGDRSSISNSHVNGKGKGKAARELKSNDLPMSSSEQSAGVSSESQTYRNNTTTIYSQLSSSRSSENGGGGGGGGGDGYDNLMYE